MNFCTMLAAVLPPSGPINVTVTAPPDTTLDNATMALATYTKYLAIATGALAALTLGTLIIFGIQITSSIRTSRPRLEPRSGGGNMFVWPRRGQVTYISGTAPAFNIEVWVQSPHQPNDFLTSTCSTLTPSRGRDQYDTDHVNQDQTPARWPFRETDPSFRRCIARAEDEWFIGLTWNDSANRLYRALWKTRHNVDELRLVRSEQPRRRLRLPLHRGLSHQPSPPAHLQAAEDQPPEAEP